MGRAEREAEFGEHLKNSQEEGFPASEPEKKLWGSPGYVSSFLTLGAGAVGGIYVQLGKRQAALISLLKMQSVFTQ